MDDPEAGPLADGADPAMCGATVEPLAVMAVQDRPFTSLAESEVDGRGPLSGLGGSLPACCPSR